MKLDSVAVTVTFVVTRTFVKHKISLALDGLGEGECGQKFGVIVKVNLSVRT